MSNQEPSSFPLSAEPAESLPLSDPDAELAESVRRTFEEIGSSNSRIVESLERLNRLALEIYCELDATTKALSLHR